MITAAENLAIVNEALNKFQAVAQPPVKTVPAESVVPPQEPEPVRGMFATICVPLIERGIPVTPVRPGTKRAFLEDFPTTATTDLNQVLVWDKQFQNHNAACVARAEDGGVWFFEADSPKVFERIKKDTGHDLLAEVPTFRVRSRPGRGHYYFRHNAVSMKLGNISQTYVIGQDWSARTNREYVVAPGSIHPDTGEPYTALDWSVPIATAPDWLIDWLLSQKITKVAGTKEDAPRNANGRVPHGAIHDFMLVQAGKLRQMGLNQTEIEPILLRIVHDECEPPIDDAKVVQMSKSICIYPPGEGDKSLLLTGTTARGAAAPTTPVQQPAQPVDVSNWRDLFRSVGEMEDGPIDMIIEGALQEGTCFIGANPGDGKTLVALAFAKAISTGTPLFGLSQFHVSKPRPVIYLIPESRDRAFRKRCEAFRIPDDKTKFMARTISAGVPLDLAEPRLLEAVRQTKAVVFLDTASRFMKGNDENAAAQNRLLVNEVVALLAAGAVCVVLVHHATKASKTSGERMTLENMLRGTGDFGAMCDQAYGIRKDMTLYENGDGPMEIELVSLKDREQIGGLTSLRLAASHKPPKRTFEDGAIHEHITFVTSYIDTTGNFKVVSDSETANREVQALEALVKSEPNISVEDAAQKLNTTKYRVKNQLEKLGYHRVKGGPDGASPWHKDVNGTCPYEKADVAEIKPAKRTFNLSIIEAAKKLEIYLAEAGPVTTVAVNQWADKQGITDAILAKAKKRVNVILDKENGTWDLPAADPARAF